MVSPQPAAMPSASILETFPNEFPDRDFLIEIEIPEFTSMCPKTGHPDFGTLRIEYTPDKRCVELKSLKLYMHGWRNVGAFYEKLVNIIINDLVKTLEPRWIHVEGEFNPRGGIKTTVSVEYPQPEDEEY